MSENNNILYKTCVNVIDRMSNLSTTWSINSFLVNSISLSIVFLKQSINLWTIGAIITIFFITFSFIVVANQYYKMELQARFIQECTTNEKIIFKKYDVLIGKGFHKLEEKLKYQKKELNKFIKLKKYHTYSFMKIFIRNKYSIWIPLILNIILFIFVIIYCSFNIN